MARSHTILPIQPIILSGATILLTIVILLFNIGWLGMVGQLFLLAYLLPLPKQANTPIFRTSTAFIVFTGLQQLIGLLFHLIDIPLSINAFMLVHMLILVVLIFVKQKYHYTFLWHMPRQELLAGGITATVIGVILLGIVINGNIQQNLLRYLTTGFDNTIHLSVTGSTYANQGYIYGPEAEVINKIHYPDLVSYPQGWHLSSAMWIRSVIPNSSLPDSLYVFMGLYTALQFLWFSLLIFMFVRTMTLLVDFTKPFNILQLLVTFCITALALLAVMIGLLRIGFSNFIPIIASCLVILSLQAAYLKSPNKLKQSELIFLLSLLIVIASSMSLTWLLAAPLGIVSLACIPLIFKVDMKKSRTILVAYITSIIFTVSVALFQISQQTLYGVKINQINETGGIFPFNELFFIICIGIALAGFTLKKSLNNLLPLLLATIITPISIAGLIYFYQHHTAGHINYYSIKLALIPYVLFIAFAGSVLITYASSLQKKVGFILASLSVIAFTISIPQLFSINTSLTSFVSGKDRKLSQTTASQLIQVINNNDISRIHITVYKQLDYEEDLIATNFIRNIQQSSKECDRSTVVNLLLNKQRALTENIQYCANKHKDELFYVFSSNKNYTYLNSQFKNMENIKVILSN